MPENFDFYKYHFRSDDNVLISYKGPFEKEVLSVIGEYIKVVIGREHKVGKRIFKVYIELAQNIAYYSSEKKIENHKEPGVGAMAIVEQDDYFVLYAGNKVRKKDIIPLIERCELINSLDIEELRAYKRKQLEETETEREGANIGLIQVALAAARPMGIEVASVDDEASFFSIKVKVDKRQKK